MKVFFTVLAVASGVGWGILLIIWLVGKNDELIGEKTSNLIVSILKKLFFGFFVFVVVASIPDVQDLWKVRIGFLKLELASPENVKSGSEEIIKIAKRLECKYQGCDDEKKK